MKKSQLRTDARSRRSQQRGTIASAAGNVTAGPRPNASSPDASDMAVGCDFFVELPMPPSVNHMYSRNRDGSVYLTAEARRFKEVAVTLAVAARNRQPGAAWLFAEDVRVCYQVFPAAHRGDLDNLLKLLNDTLQDAGIIENDRRIRHIDATRRRPDPARPRVAIRITPFFEEPTLDPTRKM